MARAAVLVLVAAVAGGNLIVTTPEKPRVWRWVRVTMTGEIRDGDGTLYVYRNRGAACANSSDDQRALGRKAVLLHAPVAVHGSFDLVVRYLPDRFGVREQACAYLYTPSQSTGLPPDAGYSSSVIRIGFAVPRGWHAGTGAALRLTAVPGAPQTFRAVGTCGGRAWRIESVPVRRDGSFAAAAAGAALRGGFRGRVTGPGAVQAVVSAPGCGTRRLRLAGAAPVPAKR